MGGGGGGGTLNNLQYVLASVDGYRPARCERSTHYMPRTKYLGNAFQR